MSTRRIYAVSLGISSYKHLGALSSTANDAQDVAQVLNESVASAEVKLLVDAAATKQSILSELAWLADASGPEDTAIIFFSGHGGRPSNSPEDYAFFCPYDASLQDIERTCITGDELTVALRMIKSERLVVLLDACYSGGIGEPRHIGVGRTVGLISRDIDGLIEGRGRMILAASRPDEPAWEVSGKRNGLFTGHLLRGLRGEAVRADGTVWASDLFGYVSQRVRRQQQQHPYQKTIGEDFVILVRRDRASTGVQAAYPGLLEIDQRALRLAMRCAYSRAELSLLCRDLGLNLEDLPSATLETQMMDLIDYCHRHGLYTQLLKQVRLDRPQLIL